MDLPCPSSPVQYPLGFVALPQPNVVLTYSQYARDASEHDGTDEKEDEEDDVTCVVCV